MTGQGTGRKWPASQGRADQQPEQQDTTSDRPMALMLAYHGMRCRGAGPSHTWHMFSHLMQQCSTQTFFADRPVDVMWSTPR